MTGMEQVIADLEWVERRGQAAIQSAEQALDRCPWWRAPVKVVRLRLALRRLRKAVPS